MAYVGLEHKVLLLICVCESTPKSMASDLRTGKRLLALCSGLPPPWWYRGIYGSIALHFRSVGRQTLIVKLLDAKAYRTLDTLPDFRLGSYLLYSFYYSAGVTTEVRAGRRVRIYCHLGTYPVFVSGLR